MNTADKLFEEQKWMGFRDPGEHGSAYIVHEEPEYQPFPEGFFKSTTRSGRDAGLGFSCYRCKFSIPCDAPKQVRHCGIVSVLDEKMELLVHRLGTHKMYRVLSPAEQIVLGYLDQEAGKASAETPAAPLLTLYERVCTWAKNLVHV